MSDEVTQDDRELIKAVLGAYHTTRLNDDPVPHILSKPRVKQALARHHTHACQECGIVWKPAKCNTHGVQFLPGYRNEQPK